MILGDLGEGAASCHHDLEFLEGDEAVAVLVDALDHAAALLDGSLLAEAVEDAGELGGGDGAVAVGVEDAEGVAEVLLDGGRVAAGGGVEGGELVEADEAIAIAHKKPHPDLNGVGAWHCRAPRLPHPASRGGAAGGGGVGG